MSEYKAYLIVRKFGTDEEIGRVGVAQLDERYVERVMLGMLRNMRDDCYVDDSEVDTARRTARGRVRHDEMGRIPQDTMEV